MVLDNWGSLDRWTAEERVTSYGPRGIGFVNFGILNELRIAAPIETLGQGSRVQRLHANRRPGPSSTGSSPTVTARYASRSVSLSARSASIEGSRPSAALARRSSRGW